MRMSSSNTRSSLSLIDYSNTHKHQQFSREVTVTRQAETKELCIHGQSRESKEDVVSKIKGKWE
jgi:hypothetical protein